STDRSTDGKAGGHAAGKATGNGRNGRDSNGNKTRKEIGKVPENAAVSMFETTHNGLHPRLTWTVNAVEAQMITVLIPRPNMMKETVTSCCISTGRTADWKSFILEMVTITVYSGIIKK
ncbi:MAG: hypothetical protein Q4C70_15000, partial [Planctomycetia bacterium]|nr:hypothetical protein [Planctomycetia bacterium]